MKGIVVRVSVMQEAALVTLGCTMKKVCTMKRSQNRQAGMCSGTVCAVLNTICHLLRAL